MGSKLWNKFKREISAITVFLFLYQFIYIIRGIVFGRYLGIFAVISGLAILACGYFFAQLVAGKKRNFKTMGLSYLVSPVFGLMTSLFLSVTVHRSGLTNTLLTIFDEPLIWALYLIFEGLGGTMLFFAGVRMRFLSHEDILSSKTLTFGVVVFVASMLLLHNDPVGVTHKSFLYAFAYIFVIFALLARNQQNLDNAFLKKHIDLSTVPKNIRNYNSRVILLIFGVIILIFNIEAVAGAIMYVISNIPKSIVLFLLFMLELLSRLFPGQEGQGEGGGGGEMDFSGLPEGQESPFWSIFTKVIFIIILGLAIFYVITRTPNMIRAIKRKLKSVINRIKNFLLGLFRLQRDTDVTQVDYVDETVTIRPAADRRSRRDTDRKLYKMSGRLWKNASLDKKIRYIYGLTVRNMINSGINIVGADTPRQIKQKCEDNGKITESLAHNTDLYERVRYGNIMPGESEYVRYRDEFKRITDGLKNNR